MFDEALGHAVSSDDDAANRAPSSPSSSDLEEAGNNACPQAVLAAAKRRFTKARHGASPQNQ